MNRYRSYMDRIRLGLEYCDGIEVANAGNEPLDDARAWLYAQEFGLVMTAGSDNHRGADWPLYGVMTEKRLTNIGDYVRMIMNRSKLQLYIPEGRLSFDGIPEIDDRHRAYRLNAQEEDIPAGKEWIG